MKSRSQMKSLLILLCVILSSCLLAGGAMAANGAVPTEACTNMQTEGIEYLVYFGADYWDADKWRTNITADAVLRSDNGTSAGRVSSIELDMANSSTRYQCTEVYPNDPNNREYSCNSLPINASITGVYIRYIPDTAVVKENTDIRFNIYQTANPDPLLLEVHAAVKYPPYPCARNYLVTRDFVAAEGESLVINTSDCDKNGTKSPSDSSSTEEHQNITFYEQMDPFALVNITQGSAGDMLVPDRLKLTVSPEASYNYTLSLIFKSKAGDEYTIPWKYTASDKKLARQTIQRNPTTAPLFSKLTESDLPLTLVRGTFTKISANETDGWGNPKFPTSTDFDIKFWYTNNEGTLGYENSVFHFNRKLNVQFAPYCTDSSGVDLSAAGDQLFDSCRATPQSFTVDLTSKGVPFGVVVNGGTAVAVVKDEPEALTTYWFHTRKCLDASCSTVAETRAYPYSMTVSDGTHLARTYKYNGQIFHTPSSRTGFNMKVFKGDHYFAITGITLVASEPGTYVVYGFAPDSENGKLVPADYAVKFYVTVNKTDEMLSCSTLANNGYFKAEWNDCLDPTQTQLLTFEHIPGTEEAWVRNTSAHGVHFPYVSEWSYVPQQLEVASLKCKFEALSAAGRPGEGYCHPDDVYVPPYTKVTITSGTLYLASSPKDSYYVAYARRDTWNISHLFFNIYVKECKNVKKIPDTGISLRSPLKVNESVDAATSYVFTGNSLRIPAIGLGMETPIPIVHVYYEDGSVENGWDLSTLGNYVGELEGGTYLPYAGNSALTGHYYSMGVFKNLEGLNMGDEVIVYGNDGVKYIYKVVQKFIAQPSDVYEMFQQVGERSLTLVTCENYNLVTDEYERRTIVRAVIDSQDIYEEGIW